MSLDPTSRAAWAQARTLTSLGALMARWLEGDLTSRPGYQPGYGPDGETRELIPALAAANRVGYVTTDSQPGCIDEDRSGTWRQRAAVQGYIDDAALLRRLKQAAAREGLIFLDGQPHTAFGDPLSGPDIRHQWNGLHREAHKTLARAKQVALVHPSWGPAGTRPLIRALQGATR